MGARWARGGLDITVRRLQQIGSDVRNEVDSEFEDIARQGAEYMQELIEDRGTAYSEYRANVLGRGTTGRNDSGTMVDNVAYEVSSYPTRVNAEVGWTNLFKKYFQYQEQGTRWIEPMFALRDASAMVRDRVQASGPKIIKRALRNN